jgi:FKBP-type peptidyl-prolyl cis-trans isomerase 2
MPITEGDDVTIEYVGRLDDGSIFDTSKRDVADSSGLIAKDPTRRFEPLTVSIGEGRVIPGLEEALEGMDEGDETTVIIPPEKAYGPYTEKRVGEYERDAFEEKIGDNELTEGFEVESDDGLPGEVTEIGEETVTVDFNHELAGKELTFDIEIVEVESAE